MFVIYAHPCSFQGILRLRGRPAVAYDQQGLVFAVAMEGGAVKLFDSRAYDKGPFDTFLVGGDTAEVCDIKFSNDGKSMLLTTTSNSIYVLDAYGGEKRCGFNLDPSPTAMEATFTPDGQYVVSGVWTLVNDCCYFLETSRYTCSTSVGLGVTYPYLSFCCIYYSDSDIVDIPDYFVELKTQFHRFWGECC
nr:protein ANTHESIS POMOTING FACTOR 1-like isoform X1 [Nicotiana tomentosiformis]